jgi:hypothetical protein
MSTLSYVTADIVIGPFAGQLSPLHVEMLYLGKKAVSLSDEGSGKL